MSRLGIRRVVAMVGAGLAVAVIAGSGSAGATSRSPASTVRESAPPAHWCNTDGVTCTEPFQNWEDFPFFHKVVSEGVKLNEYIGHDEPSVLFFSSKAGSGNDTTYSTTLPTDPSVKPQQDGNGGTFNFQLRPAFWFGMAMCDDQSAPNPQYPGAAYPTNRCTPDSNSNLYTSTSASSPHYIGKAPGGGYMEMQFYPPGWVKWPVGNSCNATRWCAALNIDSFSENQNTGAVNNSACLNSAGLEPVNFAFLTSNGVATAPANPLDNNRFNLVPSKDFFMNSGDRLQVHMFDTAAGFTVIVKDLTQGTQGEMVASQANGFASVKFAPNATTCSLVPHAFHPMFSTSSPRTRLSWSAHTYNVAMSDEIGHFEYCGKVDASSPILQCAKGEGFDTQNVDPQDDNYCLPVPGAPSTASSRINVTGCLGILGTSDIDFDGVPYDARTWPGSNSNQTVGRLITPAPLRFTSPTTSGGANFTSVAFQADLPRIEDFRPDSPFGGVTASCERFITNPADPHPGRHCLNPPPQSRDYPFYVTTGGNGCTWAEVGGLHIPGITQTFGGSSKAEFGSLLATPYPVAPAGTVSQRYNNFQQILAGNPCPAS